MMSTNLPDALVKALVCLMVAAICLASAALFVAIKALFFQDLQRIVAETDDPCDDAARELAASDDAADGETMLVEFAGSVFTQAEINKLDAVRARRRAGAA